MILGDLETGSSTLVWEGNMILIPTFVSLPTPPGMRPAFKITIWSGNARGTYKTNNKTTWFNRGSWSTKIIQKQCAHYKNQWKDLLVWVKIWNQQMFYEQSACLTNNEKSAINESALIKEKHINLNLSKTNSRLHTMWQWSFSPSCDHKSAMIYNRSTSSNLFPYKQKSR